VPGFTSVVPPTAVTYCDVAGYPPGQPSSPLANVIITPGWWKYVKSNVVSLENSPPLQLLEISLAAHVVAAVFSAVPKSVKEFEFASISTILHSGQIAETMSRSSDISPSQFRFCTGYPPVVPV